MQSIQHKVNIETLGGEPVRYRMRVNTFDGRLKEIFPISRQDLSFLLRQLAALQEDLETEGPKSPPFVVSFYCQYDTSQDQQTSAFQYCWSFDTLLAANQANSALQKELGLAEDGWRLQVKLESFPELNYYESDMLSDHNYDAISVLDHARAIWYSNPTIAEAFGEKYWSDFPSEYLKLLEERAG